MNIKSILIIGVSLILLIGFVSQANSQVLPDPVDRTSLITWSRNLEPVILEGNQVPLFSGVNFNHLYAYSFSAGSWKQIPLQVDEVNSIGEFSLEDGLLDDNDQLVFMAKDLGESAGAGYWIQNQVSKDFHRYQVEVTNPLNPSEKGYVYLYRSDTLVASHVDYVDWISDTQTIAGVAYRLGIITSPLQREETLELNDSLVDILDRSKFRLSVTCRSGGVGFPFYFTEDTVEIDLEEFYQFEPTIDGPVRVGGGALNWENWSYFALRQNQFGINFDFLTDYVCEFPGLNFGRIDAFQFSFDWVNPENSGMASMTYFDSNLPSGLPVDGIPDQVPTYPLNLWSQISGSYGSVLRLVEFGDGVIGSYENYYKDDSSVDFLDTGDQLSFGDAGFKVIFSPDQTEYGQLDIFMNEYFLGPNQPGLGETYLAYKDYPLQINISSQDYIAVLYFPFIVHTPND